MKIRVFSAGSNPAVDRPILKKSLSYCDSAVRDCLADWVNPNDVSRGIIAREFLPRENPPIFAPAPPKEGLPALEVSGVVFEDPVKDREELARRAQLIQQARAVAYFGENYPDAP